MKTSKIIKTGYYILKGRLLNKRIPISVIFSVTENCNFTCKYCNRWLDNGTELNTEQIYSMFDELAEMGTQNVTLFGGEPLLRKDLGKIIDYGKEKGFFMALSSNAYFIPKRFDEIKNVDTLLISFEGSKKVNDQLRHENSYNPIIDTIKLANQNKIPVVTYTLLTRHNIDQIDFVLDKAKELNFKAQFLYMSKEPQTKEIINEFYPDKKQYQDAVNKLIKYKKLGKAVINTFSVLDYMYDIPYPKKKMTCWAGKFHAHIASDGRLYACSSQRQHKLLGKSFPDISLKEAFENLYIDKGICQHCLCPGLYERNKVFSLDVKIISSALKKWIV